MPAKELKFTSSRSRVLVKAPVSWTKRNKPRLLMFFAGIALLALFFSAPLYHLLKLSARDDLYSDIPLLPVLSVYLVWLRRRRMPAAFKPAFLPAALFVLGGLLVLALWWVPARQTSPPIEDYLAANILALLLLFGGTCFLFLGKAFARAFACPLGLLAFSMPLPPELRLLIDHFLQHGSAVFGGLFFNITGAPVVRDGLNFHLPNLILQVAPECSGIHSTMVLIIVGITAAWLFLFSTWARAALMLAIIPLALIRNGFRIYVIGRLCMAFGPQILDSAIHRHGGPLFFVLSLFPLFLLLVILRKLERTNRGPSTKAVL